MTLLRDKPGGATLAVDPKQVRSLWDGELGFKIHFPIRTDPEEVNARSPRMLNIENGGVLG